MSYIEKEPIIEFITKGLNNPDKTKAFGYDAIEILTEIEYTPTADVVPKSEVMKVVGEYYDKCDECRVKIATEIAREIFAEIDVMFRKYYNKCSEPTELKLLEPLFQAERFIINEMWHDVSELKKKYTEVSTDEV